MRRAVVLTVVFLAAPMLSGCLDVQRPVVDANILATADHEWDITEGVPTEGEGLLSPSAVETEYRYEPQDGSGHPGLLVVVGLRTVQRIDEQDLLASTRDILADVLDEQGVEADSVTERTGTRVIGSGATSQWVTMTGEGSDESFLFDASREIRVIGEAWFDEASKMHVVAVGLAQTVDVDFLGRERRDHSVWDEIIGDAEGSIGGARHTEGFIDHVIITN